MATLENISKLKKTIEENLKSYSEVIIKTEEQKTNLQTKNIFQDYSKCFSKQKKVLKFVEDVENKKATLDTSIKKVTEHLKKMDDKEKNCLDQIDKYEKKLELILRRNTESAKFYGFHIETQDDITYVTFTKLPINNPDIKFTLEIINHGKGGIIKAIKSDPVLPDKDLNQLEQIKLNHIIKALPSIRRELINLFVN